MYSIIREETDIARAGYDLSSNFKRNKETGILEAYTEDGKYIGPIYTMGDMIANRVKDEEQSVDYAVEYQKQTGKDLETGKYVAQ